MWLGAETGLLFLDDQGQAIGSVVGHVLAHVDDMLATSDTPILHLFVDALKKRVGDHSEHECGSQQCLAVVLEFINVHM